MSKIVTTVLEATPVIAKRGTRSLKEPTSVKVVEFLLNVARNMNQQSIISLPIVAIQISMSVLKELASVNTFV